jgi:predicted nucleic acid-binding protein
VTDFVLDASVALAWCFTDEASAAADRLLDRLETERAAVPAIWHLEVANVLVLSERRRRISRAETAEFIARLQVLAIEADGEAASLAFTQILDLARDKRLTAYDAAYVELAMRLGVPLASKDRRLCHAAEGLGIVVLNAA